MEEGRSSSNLSSNISSNLRLRFCCVSAFLHSELSGSNLAIVELERGTFPLIKLSTRLKPQINTGEGLQRI